MHSLNTFLFGDDADLGREGIFQLFRDHFAGPKVSFSENKKPFGLPSSLRLTFEGGYFIDVSFIANDSVWQSVEHVAKVTRTSLPTSGKVAEVRTIFADDPNSDFDYHTIEVYDFLTRIPGAIVYDDNHKSIMEKSD